MSKSHTERGTARASELRLVPGLGLVDLARPGLPASLVDKLDGELEVFAERMHEGLMSAALAVGLEVFGELLEANATELAGPKGRHNLNRSAVRLELPAESAPARSEVWPDRELDRPVAPGRVPSQSCCVPPGRNQLTSPPT
jgi:hypothetical protein